MSLNTLTTPYFRKKTHLHVPAPPTPPQKKTHYHTCTHKYMYTATWVMFVSFIKKNDQ